jgi:hypothetical protein
MLLETRNARTIFRLAMACLALFGVLGLVHLPSTVSEDLVDGMRGALIGASIALIYLSFRLQRTGKGDSM